MTREGLLNEVNDSVDHAFRTDLNNGDGAAETSVREYVDAVVVQTLWRLAPCVQALHGRCMSTGADGEERAIALDGDAVVFAVDTPDPALVGVAVRSAAGRFVTFVRSHPDGRVQDVTVAAWKPDMAGALAALPAPLPTDNQHLVRLAESLAPYAAEGGDFHLSEIAKSVAADGRAPHESRVAFLVTHDHEASEAIGSFTSVHGSGRGEEFFPYATIMAPALGAAPAPEPQPHDKLLFGGLSLMGERATALDAGFVGQVCHEVFRAYLARGFICAARANAETLALNHDDMTEFGYVWGTKRLAYQDTDKRCFAIPTGSPRLSAIVHENIDLIADANRFLVVLHRDEAGKVERIEGHTIALPAPAITFEADIDVDELVRASEFVGIYEDADACPPRLSQREFARRLQAGEPLPTPAVDVELRSGELSTGTIADRSGLREYFGWIAKNDRWILDRIRNGEDRGIGCEARTDFGDEDYADDAPEVPAPGMR